jgi:RecA-family ATPase
MTDGAVVNFLRSLYDKSAAARDDRFRQRFANIPELVRSARELIGAKGPGVDEPLPYVDMNTWDDVPPPPRQWVVHDRIPLQQPTLLSGEGAAGKSILALQLLCATALARGIGFMPEPGPVIYLGAEDSVDEIHRRLAAILDHYRVRFAELIAGGFKVLSYAGGDAVLGELQKNGRIKPTPLFERLHRDACALRPKLIAVDALSDVFVGDEVKRDQVRQFGALGRKLCIDANSGLIMISHPSLTGISTGTGLSGSTQWHNTVRARLYLKAPDEADEEQTDLRELVFKKNQYGPISQTIRLHWHNGLWALVPSANAFEAAAASQKADNLFMTLLQRFTEQGRNVSPNKSSTYAPAKFAEQPEAKSGKLTSKDFAAAMERLLADNKIRSVPGGPPSRPWVKLEKC